MRTLAILLIWASSAILAAQDRPQFVWQGDVSGIVILRIHGDRLNVQVEGSPVTRQQYQFYSSLPDNRQDARLEVREGRGYVHIIDHPRVENSFSLAISIEERQVGSSFYSIAVYWQSADQAFERRSGKAGKLVWNGRVDEEALIACHDKTCVSRTGRGAPVANEHVKFSRPLPHRQVELSLEGQEGRGEIRLVEQPNERNNYTASVSIRDPQSGSGEYSFMLVWKESNKNAQPAAMVADRGLVWKGVVSGHVRVTVAGRSALSQMLNGASLTDERAQFYQALAPRASLKPSIKKLQGRGNVEIVESPAEKNNYTLVFEVSDSGPGAGNYQVEVDW